MTFAGLARSCGRIMTAEANDDAKPTGSELDLRETLDKVQSAINLSEKKFAEIEIKNSKMMEAQKYSNYNIKQRIRTSISLKGISLLNVERAMRQFSHSDISVDIDYSGNHSVTFDSVDMFLKDSLTKNRLVETISMQTRNYEEFKRASFRINCTDTPVEYTISGDRGSCIQLDMEINDEIIASQNWYRVLYRYEGMKIIALTMIGMVSSIYFSLMYFSIESTFVFSFALLGAFIAFPINLVLTYIMPPLQFLEGKSGEDSAKRSSGRKFIGGVVGLGTVVVFFQEWLLGKFNL